MMRYTLAITLMVVPAAHAADGEPSIAWKSCDSAVPAAHGKSTESEPQFRIGGTTPFGHRQAPTHVSIDPQGELLLTDGDGKLRLWDLRTGRLVLALRAPLRRADVRTQIVSYSYPCVIDTGFSTGGRAAF